MSCMLHRRENIHGASPQDATHRGNTGSCLTSSVDEVLEHDGLAQFKDYSNVIMKSWPGADVSLSTLCPTSAASLTVTIAKTSLSVLKIQVIPIGKHMYVE
ncbi:hypothetical protein AcW1_006258 [Taiwanofungus camphoratus]|nr:hypothetical protein AcW2_005015 [Antrodia cinnamomea]KAI0934880.1 hypothetical protein AcV5_006575 [Antrodia cinnamomea]KAI0958079.1 hypothetical protein AcW1_006258 [Antrodia cinnamomea]